MLAQHDAVRRSKATELQDGTLHIEHGQTLQRRGVALDGTLEELNEIGLVLVVESVAGVGRLDVGELLAVAEYNDFLGPQDGW